MGCVSAGRTTGEGASMGGLARWSSVRSNSCDWRARIARQPSSAANNRAMTTSGTYQLSSSQLSQEPDAGAAGAVLAATIGFSAAAGAGGGACSGAGAGGVSAGGGGVDEGRGGRGSAAALAPP